MTQSKELKQVRDALSSAIKRLETIKETFPAISVDSDIKIYRDALATLDRLSAPVGVKKIEGLEDAINATVTTPKQHLAIIKAAVAYLELQNGASSASTEIDLVGIIGEICSGIHSDNKKADDLLCDGIEIAVRYIAATGRLKV